MKVSVYDAKVDAKGFVYVKETGVNYIVDGRRSYNNPDALNEFFSSTVGICDYADERVYVACMDNKNHIIGCFEASHGSATTALFPIREILQKSLILGAINIAVAHNHPSGDFMPSNEDIMATNRLMDACKLVDIGFVDHIIVSRYGYYSFAVCNN